jgi:hypothetical protein
VPIHLSLLCLSISSCYAYLSSPFSSLFSPALPVSGFAFE